MGWRLQKHQASRFSLGHRFLLFQAKLRGVASLWAYFLKLNVTVTLICSRAEVADCSVSNHLGLYPPSMVSTVTEGKGQWHCCLGSSQFEGTLASTGCSKEYYSSDSFPSYPALFLSSRATSLLRWSETASSLHRWLIQEHSAAAFRLEFFSSG